MRLGRSSEQSLGVRLAPKVARESAEEERFTAPFSLSILGVTPKIAPSATISRGDTLSKFRSKSMPATIIAAIASITANGAISHPSIGAGEFRNVVVFSSILFPSSVFRDSLKAGAGWPL